MTNSIASRAWAKISASPTAIPATCRIWNSRTSARAVNLRHPCWGWVHILPHWLCVYKAQSIQILGTCATQCGSNMRFNYITKPIRVNQLVDTLDLALTFAQSATRRAAKNSHTIINVTKPLLTTIFTLWAKVDNVLSPTTTRRPAVTSVNSDGVTPPLELRNPLL